MSDPTDQKPSVGAGSERRPLPPAPRTPRLDTGDRIRCELARIYRLARAGHLPWETATKAGHVLFSLHRMLGDAELQALAARVATLEARR